MQNRCLQKTKTYIRFIWYAYEFINSPLFLHSGLLYCVCAYLHY